MTMTSLDDGGSSLTSQRISTVAVDTKIVDGIGNRHLHDVDDNMIMNRCEVMWDHHLMSPNFLSHPLNNA